jgi:hypothetical protein
MNGEEEECICNVDGKESPGWPKRRWADNVRRNLGEIECGGMDWNELS